MYSSGTIPKSNLNHKDINDVRNIVKTSNSINKIILEDMIEENINHIPYLY